MSKVTQSSNLQGAVGVLTTVIRACESCGAPGVDSYGHPVGVICPKCGNKRQSELSFWQKIKRFFR